MFRNGETAESSGSASSRLAISAVSGWNDSGRARCSRTTVPCSRIRPNVSRSDDVNTAAPVISVTPIISAEAVRAVRRGVRAALSRANLPGDAEQLGDRRADRLGSPGGRWPADSVVTPKTIRTRTGAGEQPPLRTAAQVGRTDRTRTDNAPDTADHDATDQAPGSG